MNWVIITGGGNGERMAGRQNKIFLKIGGHPLIYWTIKIFEDSKDVDQIVILARKEEILKIKNIIGKFKFKKVFRIITAKQSRQESTYQALTELKNIITAIDLVGIHNAVNPFVTKKEIEEVYSAARKYGASLLAHSATDTVKITDGSNFVHETPLRKYCWYAQTPQVSSFQNLYTAFKKAYKDKFLGTDDTQLLERIGIRPVIIPCSRLNFKITYPEDLLLAEQILKNWPH